MSENSVFLILFLSMLDLKISHACQADSIIYQQKVMRDFSSLSEAANDALHLRNNTGYLILKKDSLIYVSKDKKASRLYDFKLSYCDIISFEKHSFAGLIPNKIRIITLDKIHQFGTYKRKKLVELVRKKMDSCTEKPTRRKPD
ncbi:MAG: hypothetical protein ACKOE6_03565 [Flammeovirgaceae bacterium]